MGIARALDARFAHGLPASAQLLSRRVKEG